MQSPETGILPLRDEIAWHTCCNPIYNGERVEIWLKDFHLHGCSAVQQKSASIFVFSQIVGVGIDIHFVFSLHLPVESDCFDAMRRCVWQILAPWHGLTWPHMALLPFTT